MSAESSDPADDFAEFDVFDGDFTELFDFGWL